MTDNPKQRTDAEWREQLTPAQYRVLRMKGTEPAFSNTSCDSPDPGVFVCAGCGAELFRTDEKFDSGTGWPSFYAPASDDAVATERDTSHGMERIEVVCRACGGHLGHVFDDGPQPTGKRYCINAVALEKIKP